MRAVLNSFSIFPCIFLESHIHSHNFQPPLHLALQPKEREKQTECNKCYYNRCPPAPSDFVPMNSNILPYAHTYPLRRHPLGESYHSSFTLGELLSSTRLEVFTRLYASKHACMHMHASHRNGGTVLPTMVHTHGFSAARHRLGKFDYCTHIIPWGYLSSSSY